MSVKRQFLYRRLQIVSQLSAHRTFESEYVDLQDGIKKDWHFMARLLFFFLPGFPSSSPSSSFFLFSFQVHGGSTLEVTIAQNWQTLGSEGTVDVSFELHRVTADTFGAPLTVTTGQPLLVEIRTPLREEKIQPQVYFPVIQKRIFPTGNVISPGLPERDMLSENRLIHSLVNTYAFSIDTTGNHMLRLPGFDSVLPRPSSSSSSSQVLYDSPFESQLILVFDENKQLVYKSDYRPEQFNFKKGKYTARVNFR